MSQHFRNSGCIITVTPPPPPPPKGKAFLILLHTHRHPLLIDETQNLFGNLVKS